MDITFNTGAGFFIYKVGAIIIHDNKVLMVKSENSPFYYTVGGRANFGETSEAAVLREIYEETNVHFEIDRLAFVHENFYIADFLNNEPCHEIALYYLMKQSDDIDKIECNSVGINNYKESLHWLPLSELSNFHLYPEFYKTELQNVQDDGVAHFVTRDGKTHRVR